MTELGMSAVGSVADALRDSVVSPPSGEATEAVEELLPEGEAFVTYLLRFTALMVLSAGIASFGLLADSAAVVIGAMLVAPLMTPIVAAAAATVMARNARLAPQPRHHRPRHARGDRRRLHHGARRRNPSDRTDRPPR